MPTLKPLSLSLIAEFKFLRLAALQDTPAAFGSTYARESQFTDVDWIQRATSWSSDRAICYLAIENDAPCGIIAGTFDQKDPQRVLVLSMWVAPTHRRSGLGAKLVDAVERWAHSLEARELRLQVTNNNASAIRFYERCGFHFTGITEPYPNDPALIACEMVKPLH